ncbi:hypothetical protein L218DRAFT_1009884 [Marasmius fiardii PR-910]|nr:hypothetical protein L218DRAFT_1009884 [Marasmius fiardii PR-910]
MTLEAQFRALVVHPLLKWKKDTLELLSMFHTLTVPSLVIIDGLDECLKPIEQKEVLSLALATMKERLPISFLICSCPEPQIREAFNQEGLGQFIKRVTLNGDPNANQDIRVMLCKGFNKICNKRLVDKASGQFIYPATILKFIDDEDSNPCYQLQLILGPSSLEPEVCDPPPYHDLDILYTQIMNATKNHQKLLRVIAAILLLRPLSAATPQNIEQLPGLHFRDFTLILYKMHSVFHIQGIEDKVTVYHASFVDFLYDQSQSKRLLH